MGDFVEVAGANKVHRVSLVADQLAIGVDVVNRPGNLPQEILPPVVVVWLWLIWRNRHNRVGEVDRVGPTIVLQVLTFGWVIDQLVTTVLVVLNGACGVVVGTLTLIAGKVVSLEGGPINIINVIDRQVLDVDDWRVNHRLNVIGSRWRDALDLRNALLGYRVATDLLRRYGTERVVLVGIPIIRVGYQIMAPGEGNGLNLVTDPGHRRPITLDVTDGPLDGPVQRCRGVVQVNVVDVATVVVGLVRVSVGPVEAVGVVFLVKLACRLVLVVSRVDIVVQNRFRVLTGWEAEVGTIVTLVGLLSLQELVAVWSLGILGISVKKLDLTLLVIPLVEDVDVANLVPLSGIGNFYLAIFYIIRCYEHVIASLSNRVTITKLSYVTINSY